MTYLEVKLDVPGIQLAGDPNEVIGIDYSRVTAANTIAQQVYGNSGSSLSEKNLALAIIDLTDVIAEIVRGLDHGRVGVLNYPQ